MEMSHRFDRDKQTLQRHINVATVAGMNPLPNRAAYCANKSGVIGLTRQMTLQYARQGVRVNAVCLGSTLTPFSRAAIAKTGDPAAAEAFFSERLRRSGNFRALKQE